MTRRTALNALNLAHFFDHLFLLIFPTAALAIAPDWGLGYAEALALGTPLYVAFALATLPAGWLGDRFDRMALIAVFFAGCGAGSVLVAWSTGPLELMAGLAVIGAFAAVFHPVGLAMIPDLSARPGEANEKGTKRKMQPPGTHWEYNDVRVNRLALSLLRVFRRPLPHVLKERIMDPIGASATWEWHGYENSYVDIDGTKMQSVSGGAHWGRGDLDQRP